MRPVLEPAPLLLKYISLFTDGNLPGPILDLASGEGHNGVFLAIHNLPVVCWDRSREALDSAKSLAARHGAAIETRQVDLEQTGNPLAEDSYGGILVFRYLHRPLIPCIRKALRERGLLIYETFTTDQPKFGKPHNPDFLLKPGELRQWFEDWEIIHYFEGIEEDPIRATARIVCYKPVLPHGRRFP